MPMADRRKRGAPLVSTHTRKHTHTHTAVQQSGCSIFFVQARFEIQLLTLAAKTLRGSPSFTARGFPYLHTSKRVRVKFSDRQMARSPKNRRFAVSAESNC